MDTDKIKRGIKIRIIKDPVTGEDCVPPKVMELLLGLADHEKICVDCESAKRKGNSRLNEWCPIGRAFLEEIGKQPEVEAM